MKKILFLIVCFTTPFFVKSQGLTLVIDKMIVFNYDYINTGTNEGEKGPSVRIYYSLKNNTSDTIELVEEKCKIYFLYDDIEYDADYFFQFNLTEVINPYSKIEFDYSYTLLHRTPYFPNYAEIGARMDYREMLMQILPTIKMKFKYKGEYVISKEIKEVVLGEREP